MDGLGLLAIVRKTFPALPVTLTSGHLRAADATPINATQLLRKPFTTGGLVKAVRDELSNAP